MSEKIGDIRSSRGAASRKDRPSSGWSMTPSPAPSLFNIFADLQDSPSPPHRISRDIGTNELQQIINQIHNSSATPSPTPAGINRPDPRAASAAHAPPSTSSATSQRLSAALQRSPKAVVQNCRDLGFLGGVANTPPSMGQAWEGLDLTAAADSDWLRQPSSSSSLVRVASLSGFETPRETVSRVGYDLSSTIHPSPLSRGRPTTTNNLLSPSVLSLLSEMPDVTLEMDFSDPSFSSADNVVSESNDAFRQLSFEQIGKRVHRRPPSAELAIQPADCLAGSRQNDQNEAPAINTASRRGPVSSQLTEAVLFFPPLPVAPLMDLAQLFDLNTGDKFESAMQSSSPHPN